MRLDQAAIKLRPRNNWEAIDIGFTMARRWFSSLWLLWLAIAFPVFALLLIVFSNSPFIACLCFWWLKPAIEPLLIDWLGKSLFGDQLSVRDQLKRTFDVVPRMLLLNLSWGRLSLSRSYNMSVQQLEKLSAKIYSQRLRALHMTAPRSGWLTILCLHFEAALEYSAIALLVFLIPSDWRLDFFRWETFEQEWFDWLSSGIYFFGVSVVAPFYVSAGFSLYINSRTRLEAWDIEVAFRSMVQEKQLCHHGKKRGTSVMALIVLPPMIALFSPQHLEAGEPHEAKAVINEVMNDKDFGRRETLKSWRLNFDDQEKKSNDFSWRGFDLSGFGGLIRFIGDFLELSAWIAVGAVVVCLAFYLAPRIGWWDVNWKQKNKGFQPELRSVQAQDESEMGPENLIEAVMALVSDGEYRKSMSLLYRGTLKHYVGILQLEIPDSATEAECLHIIRERRPLAESVYFQNLTRNWQRLAYANQTPSPDVIKNLCRGWEYRYADK